jgi:hypothetical protein
MNISVPNIPPPQKKNSKRTTDAYIYMTVLYSALLLSDFKLNLRVLTKLSETLQYKILQKCSKLLLS